MSEHYRRFGPPSAPEAPAYSHSRGSSALLGIADLRAALCPCSACRRCALPPFNSAALLCIIELGERLIVLALPAACVFPFTSSALIARRRSALQHSRPLRLT